MRRCAVVMMVGAGAAACGSDPAPSVDDLTPGCVQVEHARFETSGDFAPAVRGTLRGWNPDGRWFLTGAAVGRTSSTLFQRAGTQVIIDHDAAAPGTIDDTQLFARGMDTDALGTQYPAATRISNLRPDGTARAEHAVCEGDVCTVCTAQLVRATHNAGEGEGDHLALLGELRDPSWGPGYTFNVRVAGTLAYLIRQDGLHIIETQDPAHPVELGHYRRTGAGYTNDIKLVESGARRFALIADAPVDVVDVTDPAAPALVAQIPEDAHTLFVETRDLRTLVYVGGNDGSCPVYDVSVPSAPIKLGRFATGASRVHDLSVAGGIAYLDAWEGGLLVVDFNEPAAPRLLGRWSPTPTRTSHSNGTTTAGGRHVALHGEESYGAHLHVVDEGRLAMRRLCVADTACASSTAQGVAYRAEGLGSACVMARRSHRYVARSDPEGSWPSRSRPTSALPTSSSITAR